MNFFLLTFIAKIKIERALYHNFLNSVKNFLSVKK